MAWIPDSEKISKISLVVLTECTNVTDTQSDRHTDRQTPHDGIGRACIASRGKNSIETRTQLRRIDVPVL